MSVCVQDLKAYAVAGLLLMMVGCSANGSPVGSSATSLYDRLGGKTAIAAVVEEFVGNVAKDNRINGRFATTDIDRLKMHLVNQVCSASGGPCVYTGRTMKDTHAGMRISEKDFAALAEDLVQALNTFKVPAKEQKELLALLTPMKPDIVEMP